MAAAILLLRFLNLPLGQFLKTFICQIGYIYEYKTSKRVFVAISGRSYHRLTVLKNESYKVGGEQR